MRLPESLRRFLEPLVDRLVASVRSDDPWERFELSIAPHHFGVGSRQPFSWYFEGESAVSVATIEEICEWLRGCEYVSDLALFHDRDFWQHPRTFEQIRRGDCEDHALWSWRKLTELGYAAELIIGQFKRETYNDSGHVWVVFTANNQTFLLDAVAKDPTQLLRPLAEVRDEYVPHAGVDAAFQTWGYAGVIYTAKLRRAGRRLGEPNSGAA